MDPVPDPLLLRKSDSAGNRTRDLCICSQKLLTTRPQRRSIRYYHTNFICLGFVCPCNRAVSFCRLPILKQCNGFKWNLVLRNVLGYIFHQICGRSVEWLGITLMDDFCSDQELYCKTYAGIITFL